MTGDRQLAGLRVLVPRPAGQAGRLAAALAAAGAQPVAVPLVEIRPVTPGGPFDDAVDRLLTGTYDWAVLTSTNGVDALRGCLARRGLGAAALGPVGMAVVGPATAAALQAWGARPDLVPAGATGAALAATLGPAGRGARVLLVRADQAARDLPTVLERLGWEVDDVVAYHTVPRTTLTPEELARISAGPLHWVLFTSPSTVTGYLQTLGGPPPVSARVAVIGPVTERAAVRQGIQVDACAGEHTADGLVAAVVATVRRHAAVDTGAAACPGHPHPDQAP